MRIIFFTWLTFLISVITLPAQQYNLKTWTSETGLPQAEVTCLLQGHRGFMWVGTNGGLATFDGLKFRTYTKEDALGSNGVSCIYQTRGAITWVGSFSNGLSRFGGGYKFTHFGQAQGLPPGRIYSITEDRDNRLWVATSKGLYYFENERFHPIAKSSGVPEKSFWTILADNQGNIWMGTLGDGLYRFNGKRTEHFLLDDGLSNKIVYSLHQSRDGNIWIGTYGGFTKYDGKKFTAYYPGKDLNINRCMDITEDGSGVLWFALDGGG
jgi:ligand-binding sensor domain-containing protein